MSFNQANYINTLTDPTIQGKQQIATAQCAALVQAFKEENEDKLTKEYFEAVLDAKLDAKLEEQFAKHLAPMRADLAFLKPLVFGMWGLLALALLAPTVKYILTAMGVFIGIS